MAKELFYVTDEAPGTAKGSGVFFDTSTTDLTLPGITLVGTNSNLFKVSADTLTSNHISTLATTTTEIYTKSLTINGTPVTAIGRAHFIDKVPQWTDGGTFTTGGWRNRRINYTINNFIGSGVTLDGAFIRMQPGMYVVQVIAPALNVEGHMARLYDDNEDHVFGYSTNGYSHSDIGATVVMLIPIFTAVERHLYVQHRCEATGPTTGFGKANGVHTSEYYTEMLVTQYGIGA